MKDNKNTEEIAGAVYSENGELKIYPFTPAKTLAEAVKAFEELQKKRKERGYELDSDGTSDRNSRYCG